MNLPITQLADSSSGIGALGIDGKALIIQVVTFLLAFWVLEHFAFKPIIKMLNQRRETIEKGVKLGEEMQKEKAVSAQKVAQEMREARAKSDEIVNAAQAQGRKIVHDAEEKANVKADGIVASAKDRIEQDTARARKQLEHEVVGLISEATEAIIDEKVDTKKDSELIDKALKQRSNA